MHVPFKIHYRNNLIDKNDSYLIPRPPSWDDRNYSYGHQPLILSISVNIMILYSLIYVLYFNIVLE
jgi:hypothetical protein